MEKEAERVLSVKNTMRLAPTLAEQYGRFIPRQVTHLFGVGWTGIEMAELVTCWTAIQQGAARSIPGGQWCIGYTWVYAVYQPPGFF